MSQINTSIELSLKNCSDIDKKELRDVFRKVDFRFFKKELVIVNIKDDSEENRLEVRKIINNHDAILILMSSNLEIANFAWNCDGDYFIYDLSSAWKKDFENALKRLVVKNRNNYLNKLAIRSHQGDIFIDPKEITIIVADGNFSTIRLIGGGKSMVTIQLGILQKKLESWTQLKRFGRSVIVNLNQIKKIENTTIMFRNDKQYSFPKYSRAFVSLRNALLWND